MDRDVKKVYMNIKICMDTCIADTCTDIDTNTKRIFIFTLVICTNS